MRVTDCVKHLASVGLLLALHGPVPAAFAHEGHDHGAPEPVAADENLVVRSASNDAYELVLKYRSVRGQKTTAMRIYLSDFATNAPIEQARVAVRTTTPQQVRAEARQTSPGVYEASLEHEQAGRYTMILSVGGASTAEFALQNLPLGEDIAAPAASARGRTSLGGWLIAAIVVALLAIVAFVVWRRSRRPISRTALLVLAAMGGVMGWREAGADAGQGHPGQPATQAPAAVGQMRYMPKESQFFLGVRTMVGRVESLRARIDAVGHVEAESGALARIESPRDGRLEAAGRRVKVGDRVQRGQVIANLLVIDALPIRAPISGLVAEVHFTPGQWVQAGAPLAVILDERQVRVELPLFGENLSRALRARTATVTTSALPGTQFPATVRGLAPTAPEAGGAEADAVAGSPIPPVLLSVTNRGGLLRPGMLVDVSLELPTADELIAVPESAVIQQEGGATVFVHTGPEVFEQRPVRVVGRYVHRVGIAGAIRAGERIVIEGAQALVSAPPVTPAPAAKALP